MASNTTLKTNWLRHAPNAEAGQILPLFVISLVVILGLVGLGLDSARLFLERRDAQAAADLAALSAGRLLPDQTAATLRALGIAAANGYTLDAGDVTFPDDDQVRVTIDTNVDMTFLAVLGNDKQDLSATAVAVHQEEVVGSGGVGEGYTIFTISDNCSMSNVIDVTSAFYSVGAWHSNSTVKSSSPNNPPLAGVPGPLHQGAHTYAACPGGNLTIGDDNAAVWDTMWTAEPAGVLPDPLCPDPTDEATCITPNDFTCDYPADGAGNYVGSWTTPFKLSSAGPHWVGGSSGATTPPTLVPGTICGALIDWDVQGATGTITVVSSDKIGGSKSGGPLYPYHESGILFAVLGPAGTVQDPTPLVNGCRTDKAIGFSSPNLHWSGVWYAPCGEAEWTGPSGVFLDASIISYLLKVSGTGAILQGYDYPGAGGGTESVPEVLKLVE